MNKKDILSEIIKLEDSILDVSNKVFAIRDIDTMSDWIIRVLNDEPTLAQSFHIPLQSEIKSALLVLLKNNSLLTHPTVNLLSQRIGAFIATIEDLYSHPMRGAKLKPILSNFEPLIRLINKYKDNYEHIKTINLIHQALIANRLHIYKSNFKEPDLRVALRAFYEDKSRNDKDSIHFILEFIYKQLLHNTKQTGFISQPRHAWWALLTLFVEGEAQWLVKKKSKLNQITIHLLSLVEYAPRADSNFATIVPELDSTFNERTWVTINAIRIYKSAGAIFTNDTQELLESKIRANFNIILNTQNDHSIKNLQSKLILLYDGLSFVNQREAMVMSQLKEIDLAKNTIGKYVYEDQTLLQFNEIRKSIIQLIKSRKNWKKPTLSSMVLSGSPGQGKSELALQVIQEIELLCQQNSKSFESSYYVIGTDINSQDQLKEELFRIGNSSTTECDVLAVVFDEFDKSDFDFYTPFLPFLEKGTTKDQSLTIFIFAQSTFPNFDLFKSYAEKLEKKSMKDFLTRIKLGTIDLVDLKISPQQKVYTTLGYANTIYPNASKISIQCFVYFATNEDLHNNRDLIGIFTKDVEINDGRIHLNKTAESKLNEEIKKMKGWINITK